MQSNPRSLAVASQSARRRRQARSCSLYPIPVAGSRARTYLTCSTVFGKHLEPSVEGWGSGLPSSRASSRAMAAVFGCKPRPVRAVRSSSPFQRQPRKLRRVTLLSERRSARAIAMLLRRRTLAVYDSVQQRDSKRHLNVAQVIQFDFGFSDITTLCPTVTDQRPLSNNLSVTVTEPVFERVHTLRLNVKLKETSNDVAIS